MQTTSAVETWRRSGESQEGVKRSGLRGKLDSVKAVALARLHAFQRKVSDRRVIVRSGARTGVSRVQGFMRTRPMIFAGVAAGAGLGLGLIGRLAQRRRNERRTLPDLVIIEMTW
ncbi:MAG: hypothetical protein ABI779_23315 [Acidobacteriota bacterium]